MALSDEYCQVQGRYLAKTEKAFLLDVQGKEIWIPRSIIHGADDEMIDRLSRGDDFQPRVREWFVDKNKL